MKASVTVPERNVNTVVRNFRVRPKSLTVEVTVMDEDGQPTTYPIDMTDEWQAANTTQRNVIKGFFDKAGTKGINKHNETRGVVITDTDLDESFFDGAVADPE
jgi:hypothetical protein